MPALLATGVALAVLRVPARCERTRGDAHRARHGTTASCRAFRSPRCCSSCFPASPGRCGAARSKAGARTGLSDSMSPGSISDLSLSDDVAFRVDFARPPPPPSQRYWRGPVFARFDGATGARCTSCAAGTFVPRGGPTRRLHGDAGAARQALAVCARASRPALPRAPEPDDPAGLSDRARWPPSPTTSSSLAKAPVTQAVRYTVAFAPTVGTFRRLGANDASDNLQLPARQSDAPSISRASCASAADRIAPTSPRCSTGSAPSRSSTRCRRRHSRPRPGRWIPVRHAPRLLRALRRRLRRC